MHAIASRDPAIVSDNAVIVLVLACSYYVGSRNQRLRKSPGTTILKHASHCVLNAVKVALSCALPLFSVADLLVLTESLLKLVQLVC